MSREWEIITADDRSILHERLDAFEENIKRDGYEIVNIEEHYSVRNIEWEALVIYVEELEE